MQLYHYSTTEYPELLSRTAQGIQEEKRDAHKHTGYHYNDSISLFFEPIPLNLPTILHHEHKFWKSGAELYQHVVDSNALPVDILFRIVETPDITELLYTQDWDKIKQLNEKEGEALKQKYLKEIKDRKNKMGYDDKGRIAFVRLARMFNRGIRNFYAEMYRLNKKYPDDGLMDKYAATVPHAMIYPGTTPIRVHKVEKIILE